MAVAVGAQRPAAPSLDGAGPARENLLDDPEVVARRRLDGGWEVPPSAFAADEEDRRRGRVRMLNGALEGGTESWTLPVEQWEPVRDVVLDLVEDADPGGGRS